MVSDTDSGSSSSSRISDRHFVRLVVPLGAKALDDERRIHVQRRRQRAYQAVPLRFHATAASEQAGDVVDVLLDALPGPD